MPYHDDAEDMVSGDCIGFRSMDAVKNHWRGVSPAAPAAGVIESDDSDDKLYHYINDSGGRDEVLQATKSSDVTPIFEAVATVVLSAALSDPPTDAELAGALGSNPGNGYHRFLQASDSAAKTYLLLYFGGSFYYLEMTSAV